MFVYYPSFNTLELKKDKNTEYFIGWKSKGLFKSNFRPLHGAFLPNIKYFGHKIGMQLNNTPSIVEQNNYSIKTVNAYIFYDLDNQPKIPPRNFTFKNCLFDATNIGKDNDKSKYVYSGYGIVYDGLGSWSFGNDFARNVISFGVDNSSLSLTDNRKNNILVLGEGSADDINGNMVQQKKCLILILVKQKQILLEFALQQ